MIFSKRFWHFLPVLLAFTLVGCGGSAESPDETAATATSDSTDTEPPQSELDSAAEPTADEPALLEPQIIELNADQLLEMRLPAAETAEGWVRLFDGSTLYGWNMAGTANWTIKDQALTVDTGEVSLLCTSIPWLDFEFKVEFRADAETNSGIFFRSPLMPMDPEIDCYELNIAPPDNAFPTGSLVKRQKVEPENLGEFDPTVWHTYFVRIVGDQVTVKLDDKELYTYTDPAPLGAGRIGLQHNSGRVEFRNVVARPVGMRSLLPDDLQPGAEEIAGWKRYPEMAGKFEITPAGELHALGGKNQLETTEQFADFALLVEAKTAGEGQNSGIFFRCIPGEEMNGYECQINNDMLEGNPLLPADCGTGGIFRRQDARIIAADQDEWFRLLLVVHGTEMVAWVNGIQVSEWMDTREPDPNPRRGQRLEAGTIILQAHDPGTDVLFRSIQVLPYER